MAREIVNLVDRRVEVYTDPTGPAAQPCYQQCRQAGMADHVDVVLAGQVVATIPVADLLAFAAGTRLLSSGP